jgi:hypothetical protein
MIVFEAACVMCAIVGVAGDTKAKLLRAPDLQFRSSIQGLTNNSIQYFAVETMMQFGSTPKLVGLMPWITRRKKAQASCAHVLSCQFLGMSMHVQPAHETCATARSAPTPLNRTFKSGQ